MKEYDVYVIVVTYNGARWLDRCFGSISASTIPLKTLVVDNGSTDGTVGLLREKYPWVHIIETGENLGFGKGNNVALSYAYAQGCDYVYLLNQDAWIMPDTIERMIAVHRKNPEYYVLSPIQTVADGVTVERSFAHCLRHCMYEYGYEGYVQDKERGKPEDVYPTRFVAAAHWLVSRDSLTSIGGFAPIFPHYGEDDNYLQRVRYHGNKVGFCPAASAVHDVDSTKWTDTRRIKDLYIHYLLKSCDINRKGLKAWTSAIWRVTRDGVRYVFRYRSALPLAMIVKSWGSTFRVVRTRSATRRLGANYL